MGCSRKMISLRASSRTGLKMGRPDRKPQRFPPVSRPLNPCKRDATHPYATGRLVMGVPVAPVRNICTCAPALTWPRLQPVGECSSSIVGSFGCSIDTLPGAGGRAPSPTVCGVRLTACHITRAACRTPQLPELCKRRICLPLLDMLSGEQAP